MRSEKIKVPRFDLMPLGELAAIYRASGVDVFAPDISVGERFAAWALFVRKPSEPGLTFDKVLADMSMDDFDMNTDDGDALPEGQPDPTHDSSQSLPMPFTSPPSVSES